MFNGSEEAVMLKGLICRLFHKVEKVRSLFTDVGNGLPVIRYKCLNCDKTFMAHSPRAIFRVYDKENKQ